MSGLRALEEAAAALVERQRTVHERVACPKCGEQVGRECVSVGRIRKTLKNPHAERLRADGIELR